MVVDTDTLRTCRAEGVERFPTPEARAVPAAPFLLDLASSDNGASLTVTWP